METSLVTQLAAGESVKMVGSGTVSLVASEGVAVTKVTAVKALPGAFGIGSSLGLTSSKGVMSTVGPLVGLAALTFGMYWMTREMMTQLDKRRNQYES